MAQCHNNLEFLRTCTWKQVPRNNLVVVAVVLGLFVVEGASSCLLYSTPGNKLTV